VTDGVADLRIDDKQVSRLPISLTTESRSIRTQSTCLSSKTSRSAKLNLDETHSTTRSKSIIISSSTLAWLQPLSRSPPVQPGPPTPIRPQSRPSTSPKPAPSSTTARCGPLARTLAPRRLSRPGSHVRRGIEHEKLDQDSHVQRASPR